MAGWKNLKSSERGWVKKLLQDESKKLQRRVTAFPQMTEGMVKDIERKISVLAIGMDVLDKACPPNERP